MWYSQQLYEDTNAIVQGINEIPCQKLHLFLIYTFNMEKFKTARTIGKPVNER